MNLYAGGAVMDKRQEIEKVAYELYEKSGYMPGLEVDHWLEAERIVCSRHAVPAAKKTAGIKKTGTVKNATGKAASKEAGAAAKGRTVTDGRATRKSAARTRVKKTGTSSKEANP
jgi:hypothetical protein